MCLVPNSPRNLARPAIKEHQTPGFDIVPPPSTRVMTRCPWCAFFLHLARNPNPTSLPRIECSGGRRAVGGRRLRVVSRKADASFDLLTAVRGVARAHSFMLARSREPWSTMQAHRVLRGAEGVKGELKALSREERAIPSAPSDCKWPSMTRTPTRSGSREQHMSVSSP